MRTIAMALAAISALAPTEASAQVNSDIEAAMVFVGTPWRHLLKRISGDEIVGPTGDRLVRDATSRCKFWLKTSEGAVFSFDFTRIGQNFTVDFKGRSAHFTRYGSPLYCEHRSIDGPSIRCADKLAEYTYEEHAMIRIRALRYLQEEHCPGIPAPPGWNFTPNVSRY